MTPTRRLLVLCLLALATPAPARAQAAPRGKQYALLVGVDKYRHAALKPLRFAEKDMEDLAELLRAPSSGFTGVRLLTAARGEKDAKDAPTAANIRAALAELVAGKGKHDTVLIALSGHGVQLEVVDASKGKPRSFAFFCPADAELTGVDYETGHSKTLISLADVFARLDRLRCGAGTRLLLVDACRNELSAEEAKRSIAVDKLSAPEGVGALFSCGAGQFAWETTKLKHGVFFHYVLEGLRGDARNEDDEVTWDRLSEHVKRKVTREVPLLIGKGATQTPHKFENSVGESPVLARISVASDLERGYRAGRNLFLGQGVKIDRAEGVRHFEKAAAKKHAPAMASLALALAGGHGVERNALRAQRYARAALPGLAEASEGGNVEATALLGLLYSNGLGVDRDYARARELLRKTVDRDYPYGIQGLAWLLMWGHGGEKNPVEAVALYRRAAEGGLAVAQWNLGAYYERSKEYEEAAAWYRKAAEQNHPAGQRSLGYLTLYGKGVEANRAEAKRLYVEAAKQNDSRAMNNLGWMAEQDKDEKEAKRWYLEAAEAGLPLAKWNLGRFAEREKKLEVAVRYWREAAEGKNTAAANRLGWYYQKGEGGEKDTDQAMRWFRVAAEAGHADAQDNLAWLYIQQKKYAEALPWVKKSAAQGNRFAESRLGDIHRNGWGVPQSYERAAEWYRKAAEKKQAYAQQHLGRLYEDGKLGEGNAPEALRWYRLAADLGHADAQDDLGRIHIDRKEYSTAIPWLEKAAAQGNAFAQNRLGNCYRNGWGVSQSHEKAAELYRQAAEKKLSFAQYNLGRLHDQGKLGEADTAAAMKWYRLAAEQGHSDAQDDLARTHIDRKEYAEALAWLKKAVAQGNRHAQNRLGVMHYNGWAVPQSYEEAARWYRQAAEQKLAVAQDNLGWLYANGKLGAVDLTEAIKWYRLAADQGHANAMNNLGSALFKKDDAQSKREGASWFGKAAEKGNMYGQYNYGRHLREGTWVAKDEAAGRDWIAKAAAQKYAPAVELLRQIGG